MVAKLYLEPLVDSAFHPDSYGYRPGKSAIDAIATARQRCWRNDWVLDLDIKAFFDEIDHDLLMCAVSKHTDSRWLLLYIERWLKAPAQLEDGTLVCRDKGSPQGAVISPLLANLFLHYAFDEWMRRNFSSIPFERYADDILVHCRSKRQARWIKSTIEKRLQQCKLRLNPNKTKMVYCKDSSRRGKHPNVKFDFLGYTFRPRLSKNRYGEFFVNFCPAVSEEAAKAMRRVVRSWRIHRMSDKSIEDLSRILNTVLRGWINYYGRFYKSALYPVFDQINCALKRWAMRKYRKLRGRQRRARYWLGRIARHRPYMFVHWRHVRPAAGR
jgi:RNA-directed DNA polymerase